MIDGYVRMADRCGSVWMDEQMSNMYDCWWMWMGSWAFMFYILASRHNNKNIHKHGNNNDINGMTWWFLLQSVIINSCTGGWLDWTRCIEKAFMLLKQITTVNRKLLGRIHRFSYRIMIGGIRISLAMCHFWWSGPTIALLCRLLEYLERNLSFEYCLAVSPKSCSNN